MLKMKTKKRPPHRPPFEATGEQRALVTRLRLAGFKHDQIAGVLGIHEQTLRKHFSHELDHATRDLLGGLAALAYQKALAGDAELLRFMLRTKGGFIEREQVTAPPTHRTAPPAHRAISRIRLR